MIAGLGNPGKRYRFSRHNLGFLTVDKLAERHQAGRFWPRFAGRAAKVRLGREEVVLLKPYTYMNRSGESVAAALDKYRLQPEQLIVIHDDLDLEPGQLKLGFGLSSAGHNGIESIIERLGSKDFYRVRLGIGKPPAGREGSDYVLEPMSDEERAQLEPMLEKAAAAVETLVAEGLEKARNLFHRKN